MTGRVRDAACAAPLLLLFLASCATQTAPVSGGAPVTLGVIALNDFHGNLEPPAGGFVVDGEAVPAGGAEYLASAIASLRDGHEHSIVVAAGDLIGASPLLSGLFHDEPSIEALSLMGLDVAAVGNHEFDEGPDELRRMQEGGCHPVDGCMGPGEFSGAMFRYLAAGAIDRRNGETMFPPYEIREFGGAPVAFIGMTLEGTSGLISPEWRAQMEFRDEAETVNALVPEIRARGAEAIVLLIHEGGEATGGYDECPAISGPIVEIVEALDPAVDAVITGHTHQAYNCRIAGRPVTSAGSYGMALTELTLTLDPATGDVTDARARNIVAAHAEHAADPAQTALLDSYRAVAAPLMTRPAGSVAAPLSRSANAAGESALGDVIADAQLAATPDAMIAFMNPGGIRADISGDANGAVSFNDLYTAQPFGNVLTAMTLSGAEIAALLEQQFSEPDYYRVLQVSDGFTYAWDNSAPTGAKVVPGSIALHGEALDPAADYRIVANNFIASGGDGFTVFTQGRDVVIGVSDVEALEAWFNEGSPVAPGTGQRVQRIR